MDFDPLSWQLKLELCPCLKPLVFQASLFKQIGGALKQAWRELSRSATRQSACRFATLVTLCRVAHMHFDMQSRCGRHVDEGVQAEQVDLASHEI